MNLLIIQAVLPYDLSLPDGPYPRCVRMLDLGFLPLDLEQGTHVGHGGEREEIVGTRLNPVALQDVRDMYVSKVL